MLYDEAGNDIGFKLFLSFQNIVPPIAGTQYHAIDQGTATPKHMRATMYNVPETENLRKATRLPMAVTVRPFAPLLPLEDPVPTVDMLKIGFSEFADISEIGPPRCRRCRTYINPLMTHTLLGKFICNVCQFPNNICPADYVAPLDMSGQRTDRQLRPELHRGVYDIIVPDYYNVGGKKENHVLHHVFLIDVSQQARKKNLPVLAADAIRLAVFAYDDKPPAVQRFLLILFDKKVHFFDLSPHRDVPQEYVMADLDDPYVPIHHGLFADAAESGVVVEEALNHLELLCASDDLFADTEPCFSVALRAAGMALEQCGGGKITSVLLTLPTWGPGGLKLKENRNVGRNPTPETERKLYSADNEYYKLLALDFVKNNVGLDFFAVSNSPVDMSNIGWLAAMTGGHVKKWLNFSFERDGRALTADIVKSVESCAGYQGQLKLRCLSGLQVSQYYGFSAEHGILSQNDPQIPILSEDQSFTVFLQYDGQLNTKYDCHFQAAMLYTDPQGVRKVRVVNLVLAVSERLEDVFNFVDQDAVAATIVRDTLSFVGKESVAELRRSVSDKLVDVFTQYRLMTGHHRAGSNQLIFPDSLRHLPVLVMLLIKSRAVRDALVSLDSRLADVFQMLSMPLEKLAFHLYPALVALHDLAPEEGLFSDEHERFLRLPEFLPLLALLLLALVHVLCDGTSVYLRVHPDAPAALLQDLFGVSSINEIDDHLDALPELPTHISQQARNLVKWFQRDICGAHLIADVSVQVVKHGISANTAHFAELLVEDHLPTRTVNTDPTYLDFLTSLHKSVKEKCDAESGQYKDPSKDTETLAQRIIQM